MPVRDFLDWSIWGGKTHSHSGHTSDGSSRKRTWKEGTFAFCLLVLTLTVHLSCCWDIHLLVLEPTSSGFLRIDWRPVLSSLGILWNSKNQMKAAGHPASWTNHLPDSWSFCQETAIVWQARLQPINHSKKFHLVYGDLFYQLCSSEEAWLRHTPKVV